MDRGQIRFSALFSLIAVVGIHAMFADAKEKEGHKEVHILDQEPPTYLCPDGFTMQGRTCILKTYGPMDESCAAGHLIGDQCVSFDEPIYTCPQGYIPFEGTHSKGKHLSFGLAKQCLRMENAEFEESCLDGSQPTSQGCPVEETVPVEMVCPIDNLKYQKHHSTDCVSYGTVEPIKSCGHGFTLENGLCVGSHTVPCSTQKKKVHHHHVHHHHSHDKSGKSHGFHRLLGKKGDDKKDDTKDKKIIELPVYEPVPVEMCETRTEVPAILTCPPGSSTTSSKGKKDYFSCVTATKVPLEPRCSVGTLNTALFVCGPIIKYEASLKQCPAGFVQCDAKHKHMQSCCAVDYAAPDPSCEGAAVLENGRCKSTHPFVYSCRAGSVQVGDQCVTTETAPVKVQYSVRLETTEPEPKKHKVHHHPHVHAHHVHHHHTKEHHDHVKYHDHGHGKK